MAGACLISASPKLRNRYQQPKLGALGQAELVRSSYGKIDLKLALNTHRFDFAEVQKMPGWLQELQGGHTPETEERVSRSKLVKHPEHPLIVKPFGHTLAPPANTSKNSRELAGIQHLQLGLPFWQALPPGPLGAADVRRLRRFAAVQGPAVGRWTGPRSPGLGPGRWCGDPRGRRLGTWISAAGAVASAFGKVQDEAVAWRILAVWICPDLSSLPTWDDM